MLYNVSLSVWNPTVCCWVFFGVLCCCVVVCFVFSKLKEVRSCRCSQAALLLVTLHALVSAAMRTHGHVRAHTRTQEKHNFSYHSLTHTHTHTDTHI